MSRIGPCGIECELAMTRTVGPIGTDYVVFAVIRPSLHFGIIAKAFQRR